MKWALFNKQIYHKDKDNQSAFKEIFRLALNKNWRNLDSIESYAKSHIWDLQLLYILAVDIILKYKDNW